MEALLPATEISANAAIRQRFYDLPTSQRRAFVEYLKIHDQYNHFYRKVIKPGWDLADTRIATAIAIQTYLGVSLESLCSNSVLPATFEEYSVKHIA